MNSHSASLTRSKVPPRPTSAIPTGARPNTTRKRSASSARSRSRSAARMSVRSWQMPIRWREPPAARWTTPRTRRSRRSPSPRRIVTKQSKLHSSRIAVSTSSRSRSRSSATTWPSTPSPRASGGSRRRRGASAPRAPSCRRSPSRRPTRRRRGRGRSGGRGPACPRPAARSPGRGRALGLQCHEPTPAIFCASLSWTSRRRCAVISVERPITATGRPASSKAGVLWVR